MVSLCMDDELRRWQQQLVSEIKTDDQRIHELQSQRSAKYQKLKHLDALIGFSASDELRGESRVKRSQKFLDDCERILRASSGHMHVNELAQRLRDSDIRIPGAGVIQNVITELYRSPRFKRVRPGTYVPVD